MKIKIVYMGEKGSVERELVKMNGMLHVLFETATGRKFTVQFADKGESLRIREVGAGSPLEIIPEATNAFTVK